MTVLLNQHIKTRGFWRVRIHPTTFSSTRVPAIANLKHLVSEVSIEVGSAAFPVTGNGQFIIGQDWIGAEADAGEFRQTWRMYQSAQIMLYEAFFDDWWDKSPFGSEPNWKPNTEVSVGDALVSYWQVYELAARLASRIDGEDPFHVSIHAFGLQGRQLRFRFRNRARLRGSYTASLVDFPVVQTLSRQSLIATPVDHAVAAAKELFARFGWDVAPEFLRTLLGESGVSV